MRKIYFSLILLACALYFSGGGSAVKSEHEARYMAFCNDGDGPVSEWVVTRNDAYQRGRDHELAFRGHRWEILVETAAADFKAPSCALVSDAKRPGILRLENTCGECRVFRVSRRTADGQVKTRDLTVKPNGRRFIRKLENAQVAVEGESSCPGN